MFLYIANCWYLWKEVQDYNVDSHRGKTGAGEDSYADAGVAGVAIDPATQVVT